MRTPSVWLVTDVYPPDCGGSGWSTHALALVLLEYRHRVQVVELDPCRDGVARRVYEGVDVETIGLRSLRRSVRRRLGARDYSYDGVASRLDQRLRCAPDVDIVHAQHLHSGPPAIAMARAHGRGAVITLRDHWPVCLHGTAWWGGQRCSGCTTPNLVGCMGEYFGLPWPMARAVTGRARRRLEARRRGVEAAHRVIAVGSALSQRVSQEVEGEAPLVVPNIVDPERTAAAARRGAARDDPAKELPAGYLLAAGKLTAPKGYHQLIDWLGAIEHRPSLVVAGSGPAEAELQRLAHTRGVQATFLGWLDHDRLMRLAKAARAVVVPSLLDESLSRIMLEAMSLGTPVVSWDRGGQRDAIKHGENGWLVDEPHDLKHAISELLDDDRRHTMATAARQTVVERFSPRAVYPLLAAVYEEAAVAAGRR